MNFKAFLDKYLASADRRKRIVHQETIPPRPARYADLQPPLPQPIAAALARQGVTRLYVHQAAAVSRARAGENVLVVTSTASGKTLCYNLPVMETMLADPEAAALYLFPTKALAQDQLRALRHMAETDEHLGAVMASGTYDGDTPGPQRRRLRDRARVILTNPDMLHVGILPYHSRWSRLFSNLRFVVIDEVHVYRGIFGSHVANVIRRLRRIARHYGANPHFIASSATIANPLELAGRLIGEELALVDDDGSPKGPRRFLFWNPPAIDVAAMSRRSANDEAKELMTALVSEGVQTIAFAKTRLVAELLYRYCRQALANRDPSLVDTIRPYRAGYLPEERREIERLLFSGALRGVTSTNALELGIDVGGLDASIMTGYPGTVASTWQQAGRAGRSDKESLVALIAYSDPIDQYLMRHPDYFFGQSPEHGIVDAENPYILAGHLRCAAFELPLSPEDSALFGSNTETIAGILEEERELNRLDQAWYWSSPDFPAAQVNLRTVSDDTFTIMDKTQANAVLGTVDAISAPELVYPGGVYLHRGESYLVRDLDLEARAAYVEKADVDYYTQAVLDAHIRITAAEREKESGPAKVCFGEASVTWKTTAFKKIKFHSMESIGYGKIDLPSQTLETTALWLMPRSEILAQVRRAGLSPIEGLAGIRNVAVLVLPMLAMCDRQDLGGIVDSSNTGTPTIFIYDRYPGGLGFSERGYDLVDRLLEASLELIRDCPCRDGCPSCVGSPIARPPQHADLDLGGGSAVPSKKAAVIILESLLGKPHGPPQSGPDLQKIARRVRQTRRRKRTGL